MIRSFVIFAFLSGVAAAVVAEEAAGDDLGASLEAVSADNPTELLPARIKDVVNVEGVRENMLVGYGLVVGLNGTGDNLTASPFTQESLLSMLERLGINTRDRMQQMRTRNVAAVMVTAKLPPFARQGGRIDVTVSAMGDAKSLTGGVLLVTPLLGADGEVYAVAQGSLATSAFSAEGKSGTSITKGFPTSAMITGGGIVEREIPFALANVRTLRLSLKNPDFVTAARIADVINARLGAIAESHDSSTVLLTIPPAYQANPSLLIAALEPLYVVPDQVARVVLDEREGVIVMGENVRISTVAISQGNLTVNITESTDVSQPNPFASGTTQTAARSTVGVTETSGNFAIQRASVTLSDFVKGLNALNVSTRDMSSILRAVKAAGAMQAELEIR